MTYFQLSTLMLNSARLRSGTMHMSQLSMNITRQCLVASAENRHRPCRRFMQSSSVAWQPPVSRPLEARPALKMVWMSSWNTTVNAVGAIQLCNLFYSHFVYICMWCILYKYVCSVYFQKICLEQSPIRTALSTMGSVHSSYKISTSEREEQIWFLRHFESLSSLNVTMRTRILNWMWALRGSQYDSLTMKRFRRCLIWAWVSTIATNHRALLFQHVIP